MDNAISVATGSARCCCVTLYQLVPRPVTSPRATLLPVSDSSAVSTRDEGGKCSHDALHVWCGVCHPHWSLRVAKGRADAQLIKPSYFTTRDDRDECIRIATEREPVNIAMNRLPTKAQRRLWVRQGGIRDVHSHAVGTEYRGGVHDPRIAGAQ